jgi:PKHD-type hydroxylase
MIYKMSKYNAPLECFAIWRDGFTEEEIEKIVFLEKLQIFDKGLVSNNIEPEKDVRDSDISWIHPDENSDWVFRRMADITTRVNYDHFLYDIDSIQAMQYTKYSVDQHYTWHWDVTFGWENFQRKISLVMLLSDPEEYEGGEFEICINGNLDDIRSFKPKKGDIIFFAAWMPHRVKPVTSGERKSLVCWVLGKRES